MVSLTEKGNMEAHLFAEGLRKLASILYLILNGETSDGIFVIFNPNSTETSVTLPDGAWDVCVNADHAGTEALTTVSGSVSVEPISAMVLVKKES